ARDVLRLARALQRNAADHLVELLFRDAEVVALFLLLGEPRLGQSRRDRVDVDAEAAPLLRDRARDADVALFCRGVVDLARIAAQRRRREKIDHLAVVGRATVLLDLLLG